MSSASVKIIDDIYNNRPPRVYEDFAPTLRSGRQGLKVVDTRNEKEKFCDEILENGMVGDMDIINHSYTSSRRADFKKYANKDGVAPTMTTRPDTLGIVTQSKIVIDDYNGRIRADQETMGTLTTNCGTSAPRNGYKIAIKEATKKGYAMAEEGDSVNLQQPNSTTRRGRVGNGVSNTLQCSDTMGVVDKLRIRKLTPKECWRLMGFDDEDYDKAEKVNSNAQLYKQAGNSIVVNVLESILGNLLKGKK